MDAGYKGRDYRNAIILNLLIIVTSIVLVVSTIKPDEMSRPVVDESLATTTVRVYQDGVMIFECVSSYKQPVAERVIRCRDGDAVIDGMLNMSIVTYSGDLTGLSEDNRGGDREVY